MGIRDIYGQLSRCRTASGSNTGLFRVGSTKVKARTSFLYTEGAHKVYIRNIQREVPYNRLTIYLFELVEYTLCVTFIITQRPHGSQKATAS